MGISCYYPIYSAFESSFHNHLHSDPFSSRTATILHKLHLPELERAQALECDIKLLLPSLHQFPNTSTVPRLEAFKRHVQSSLSQKPHLLLAYTWIFYMALFSGGRYIRSKLRAGLATSIASLPSAQLDGHAGLSFWEFPGELDGEDLKLEYKSRVAALSAELTEEERRDIVAEGVQIMIFLIDLVKEVAEAVPARVAELALEAGPSSDKVGFQGPVARIRPPWILLMRNLFPMYFMEIVSAALGVVASRAPDKVTPIPVQLQAE
ncbi:MAG: hypothetical protein Q9225_006653 [Loekoesia sp. 1 TL-2023]